ncbi:MAG: phage holin family protein [Patescibacteria group bacterium]
MKILITWLFNAAAVMLAAYLLPSVVVDSFGTALIVALVLGVVNVLLKPILIILTLPINILTLGLFTLVINAALILLTDGMVQGFAVGGFWSAVIFSLILAVVNGIFGSLKKD